MTPANIVDRLLHRDADLLVIDKPAGVAVHPGPGRPEAGTVTAWLDALRFGLPRRPELAHRLDRQTSGCLVLGRHRRALARLSELFRAGVVEKTYWAVVDGVPAGEAGEIALPLARRSRDAADWRMRPDPSGEPALTRWRVLAEGRGCAWLELRPVTGRTHQLRVHCAAMGWPIRGDATYGGGAAGRSGRPGDAGPTLLLHARGVVVPFRPRRPPVSVEAPAPPPLAAAIAAIERDALSSPT